MRAKFHMFHCNHLGARLADQDIRICHGCAGNAQWPVTWHYPTVNEVIYTFVLHRNLEIRRENIIYNIHQHPVKIVLSLGDPYTILYLHHGCCFEKSMLFPWPCVAARPRNFLDDLGCYQTGRCSSCAPVSLGPVSLNVKHHKLLFVGYRLSKTWIFTGIL